MNTEHIFHDTQVERFEKLSKVSQYIHIWKGNCIFWSQKEARWKVDMLQMCGCLLTTGYLLKQIVGFSVKILQQEAEADWETGRRKRITLWGFPALGIAKTL